ncbi:EAL domain-containing protein [Candidatus Vondammii sp. HM_W22]|uniref:EAL domain-containing protein n=1 Tax=Candidatus Vondammii sp. HM_W22 TaxID=2687299 RepID=UPI002E7B54C4|nr:EAL domain-containing protein [Candidatus Vondammii sp. HM_W22]
MGDIQELGCKFALDNFGVGFSSFIYLKELLVDILKIDGSFIRQLAYSPDDRVFVKALNEVAVGLGKETVAEFIKNEEGLQLLAVIGYRKQKTPVLRRRE